MRVFELHFTPEVASGMKKETIIKTISAVSFSGAALMGHRLYMPKKCRDFVVIDVDSDEAEYVKIINRLAFDRDGDKIVPCQGSVEILSFYKS